VPSPNRTGTNPALAKKLDVSLPTIKKMWLSIYGRIAEHAPELIAEDAKTRIESKCGKEKRRRLLAYLQEHPEQLGPVSRRRTGQKSSRRSASLCA
jgi:hypothetical protein